MLPLEEMKVYCSASDMYNRNTRKGVYTVVYVVDGGERQVAFRSQRFSVDGGVPAGEDFIRLDEIPVGYETWWDKSHDVAWFGIGYDVRLAFGLVTEEDLAVEIAKRDAQKRAEEEEEAKEAGKASGIVHSERITEELRTVLGDWTQVKRVQTISHAPGTGYKDYIYEIDGRYQVTVSANNYN